MNPYRIRKWGEVYTPIWLDPGLRPWIVYNSDGEGVARFATWEEAYDSAFRWCTEYRGLDEYDPEDL